MSSRLRILTNFSIAELVVLFLGKAFGPGVSEKFKDLQDRENKLAILHRYARPVETAKDHVIVDFDLGRTRYKCQLRLRGSDVWVFNQIVAGTEYQHVISHYVDRFKKVPETMIDAGANIGLTTLLLKSANPKAKIIAIEPDEDNYRMAKRNFELNNLDINLSNAALWPVQVKLEVINDFRDRMNWSFRVQENEKGRVVSLTPMQAIDSLGGIVDIFKMDVEGGEAQIFDSKYDLTWLEKVKVLAIEIHDEYSIRAEIIGHLLNHNFEISNCGELTIGTNKSLTSHPFKQSPQ